jgi:GNAT superfamily N-acetyltransferase
MRTLAEILAFLKAEPLKYIIHLKMLDSFAGVMRWDCEPGGVALLLPAAANPYDATTYPGAEWIVFLAVNDPATASKLVERLARDPWVWNPGTGARLVFKLVDAVSREAVLAAFPARRVTGFVSYTTEQADLPHDPWVEVAAQLDPRLVPCYQSNGYTLPELERMFGQESRSFSLFAETGAPQSTCMIFKNFGPVWEIGGVYTDPANRRQGLGRRVVARAVQELLESGRIPRYQVKESNLASRALAEGLGMRPFVYTEHFVMDGSR